MNLVLDGEKFRIQQDGNNFLDIDPTPDDEKSRIAAINSNGNSAGLTNQLDTEKAQSTLTADFDNGAQRASIRVVAKETGAFALVIGLLEFEDNEAALTAGLDVNTLYIRTGHGLDIVVD